MALTTMSKKQQLLKCLLEEGKKTGKPNSSLIAKIECASDKAIEEIFQKNYDYDKHEEHVHNAITETFGHDKGSDEYNHEHKAMRAHIGSSPHNKTHDLHSIHHASPYPDDARDYGNHMMNIGHKAGSVGGKIHSTDDGEHQTHSVWTPKK